MREFLGSVEFVRRASRDVRPGGDCRARRKGLRGLSHPRGPDRLRRRATPWRGPAATNPMFPPRCEECCLAAPRSSTSGPTSAGSACWRHHWSGPAGRVIAVEPNPRNVALLRQSAKDNGFDNIDVAGRGAGRGAPGGGSAGDRWQQRTRHPDRRPPAADSGGQFRRRHLPSRYASSNSSGSSRVDVMKIDVEGAEPLVLRGSDQRRSRRAARC